ncbi:hypothetical protein [Streptomyces flavidovirens]|uniref:Uncharacterized protein n=1 Tax=Streptomyces flavidovirens TaxID=67298 RepID=A0ABW6RA27_9ACTN
MVTVEGDVQLAADATGIPVRIVSPANGERADLVETTAAGRTALAI